MFQRVKNAWEQGVSLFQKYNDTRCLNLPKMRSFNLPKIYLLFRVSICQNIRKQGVSICRKNKGVSTCQKHTGTRCFNMSKNTMTHDTRCLNLPKMRSNREFQSAQNIFIVSCFNLSNTRKLCQSRTQHTRSSTFDMRFKL